MTANKVTLNRKQLNQLLEIYNKFQEVENFTLEESHSSGIGPSINLKFTLFDMNKEPDTNIDLTDVSTW